MNRLAITTAVVLLGLAGTGCAPTRFLEGVGWAADKYRCREASTLRVADRGHLRFDTRLRSDMRDAIGSKDLQEMKSEGARLLAAAHDLAIRAVGGEIERMSPEGLAFLVSTYHLQVAGDDPAECRQMVKSRFLQESRAALEADLAALHAATDLGAARNLLKRIAGRIEAPVGDRGKLGRVLLSAPLFLPAAIEAEIADAQATRRAVTADFEHVFVYRPPDTPGIQSAAQLASADEEHLARWFAPVFIQQTDPGASYPTSEDQFGRVYLAGTRERIRVHVDLADPTVYWTHQQAKIGRQRYDQLVYVAWYPSRPALKPGDQEAGHIDGVVLRITLDHHRRPAVYEFVRSCGCHHTLWVAEFVEASARREYGDPLPGKRFVLQKPALGRQLFIPELVPDDGSHPSRPLAYVSAGYHLLMGIEPGGEWQKQGQVVAERSYRLQRYETLSALPLGGNVASMFGDDGLVHDAGRVEGWLLAPTGMLSAGQPRQLGTMKIRLDAYDYDDPRLLERQLRFPQDF